MSKFRIRYLALAAAIVLIIALAGFVLWASTPLGPSEQALTALVPDDTVDVEDGEWLVFRPRSSMPETGLIFYPGGRVDYRSYAPQLRAIAEQGTFVVVPPMPLNLAIFGANKADDILDAYPEIEKWAIAGHSLGGAMAAQYISGSDQIENLLLWAAYPASSNDLSTHAIAALSISATEDGLATPDKIDASVPLLPSGTSWVAIEGGNHAQFGSYGQQPGDGTASISAEEQLVQIVAASVSFLSSER